MPCLSALAVASPSVSQRVSRPPSSDFRLLRRAALLLASLVLTQLVAGCSSSGDAESSASKDCVAGHACACKQDGDQSCTANGCAFTCEAGAKCTFHCPTGGCTASGAGNILVECAGGGCALSCGTPRADCKCSDPSKCTTG